MSTCYLDHVCLRRLASSRVEKDLPIECLLFARYISDVLICDSSLYVFNCNYALCYLLYVHTYTHMCESFDLGIVLSVSRRTESKSREATRHSGEVYLSNAIIT